ncbi:MAG: mandelate racemase [Planctomycetes bacterium]|nr:mandelate racemase [Planctomycetota bacterium]MBL7146892.1 mandelate racemase [Phycisphaerae bacterium]
MIDYMKRRNFLTSLAALGVAPHLGACAEIMPTINLIGTGSQSKRTNLKITKVEILRITGKNKKKMLYLKINTNEGLTGLYGPIDNEAAMFVDQFFRRRLIGQDPLAYEAYWDSMFRADRHSRGSHYIIGLSAVDNALWDLRGRLFGLPVYRLLGGSRNKLQAYASCLGFSQEPSALQAKARELKQQGYRHQKWFVRDRGPSFGPEGVEEDVKVVRLLREAVGDDVDLMFDAFWQWDLQYALAWTRRTEQYRPRWIEEPFQTANLDAFIELSRETSIPVATGEHFYSRYDVHKFLKADAIMVVQADPEWCGGVSELVKICTLASVHGVNVIPHGHSLHAAMHVVASQPIEVCPLVEYLIQKMNSYYDFEKHQPKPVNGILELSDRPGFGIEFDESKIADIRPVSWKQT